MNVEEPGGLGAREVVEEVLEMCEKLLTRAVEQRHNRVGRRGRLSFRDVVGFVGRHVKECELKIKIVDRGRRGW